METTSTRPVVVGPGGTGVVAHVGLHALCAFADRLGLGDELSSAIPRPKEPAPLHDRGKVLVHAMAMLAGGGEAANVREMGAEYDDVVPAVFPGARPYRDPLEIVFPRVRPLLP
ncbi:MAG: hypothetical protein M0004_01705 [Actinomycetota bacterium]|nr:hypothetical protein [Actinomycetota bacterium]